LISAEAVREISTAMEESERPTEFLEEQIQDNALHSRGDWAAWVAVTTAILAAFAAVGSLLSNSRSNEAMMLQIQSTDQWSYYQEKGLKATLLASKIELLEVLNRPVPPSEKDKIGADLDKQEAAKAEAEKKEREAHHLFRKHEAFSWAVTGFQIGISISAISLLTKRRGFWLFALASGAAGLLLLLFGFLR
jgi:Domain of unknown function (DUF4337)